MRSAMVLALLATLTSAAAAQTPRERLDRGLVALQTEPGKVYLSWRLLTEDGENAAFDVLRAGDDAPPAKLNDRPLGRTTDFLDAAAPREGKLRYVVRLAGKTDVAAQTAAIPFKSHLTVKLADAKTTVQKVGVADLDGDRRLDFVIKQPKDNIDPYEKYWQRSPDTYKLEAYAADGRFLWRYDLGWAIERGIWYSPYVVYDLDGDGRAEVAAKTGEGDPRDSDGRVTTGPERLTILDGRSGKPIAETDWPARSNFTGPGAYNYSSRNQLAVAWLDGKSPALIVARGTYNYMTAIAYRLEGGERKVLRELWRWDNKGLGRDYQGQGAHWMHAADVDGDGRDEVLLGSIVLDDDGKPLWTTGLGHPDHFYLGDLDPTRPGLEIYYGIERKSKKNAMCMVDARTGKILWGHDEPTEHIHSSGLCADLDPAHPGSECYSGERDDKTKRWLRTAQGKTLSHDDLGGLAPRAVYWDADPQRELLRGHGLTKYPKTPIGPRIEGETVAVLDLLGDWREEIVSSVPGELRIYVSTVPAIDRRPCLLQDPIYRADVTCATMGYYQIPMLGYDLSSGASAR